MFYDAINIRVTVIIYLQVDMVDIALCGTVYGSDTTYK